jgi:hypothetical protein
LRVRNRETRAFCQEVVLLPWLLVQVVRRPLAVFVGMAFMLSTLFGIIHEATTAHVRCAEHGELIHGEPGSVAATSTWTVGTHATLDRGALGTGESRGHEHCQLTASTHESRWAPQPPALVTAPAIASDLVASPQRVLPARSESLYLTAPKTSPPA